MLDLQKANMWKRISAWLFDTILLFIVVAGFAFLTAWIVRIDDYQTSYEEVRQEYAEIYNIDLNADTSNFTEEELAEYEALCEAADEAFSKDERAMYNFGMMFALTAVIIVVSVFLGYLIMEFVIPLILKEGRTLGKKIFGICLMRSDGVRITGVQLFVRSILGKCTVETMLPLMLLILIIMDIATVVAPVALIAIFGTQVILLCSTQTRATIHDKMAGTVVVDFTSQMIFDTPEELLAYKQRLHEERAERSPY